MATLHTPDSSTMVVDEEKKRVSSAWTGAAFVVESLVLLAAIVACMAVFTSLFAKSAVAAKSSTATTRAVQLAQSAAEEFSSDPASVADGKKVGKGVAAGDGNAEGLSIDCAVDTQSTDGGTFYTAHISVASEDGSVVYSVDASRYVKGAR
ncbi:hypothetical protein [Paratractidigestivibacter sp.]|uniref:hypothetical protein n=1 Tax=Paratractidigestivibacter sp. TaxID=2847316 RepID=UPI002ABE3C19|nr:hypothetical protein [Paratractidigestivibacter sp.]